MRFVGLWRDTSTEYPLCPDIKNIRYQELKKKNRMYNSLKRYAYRFSANAPTPVELDIFIHGRVCSRGELDCSFSCSGISSRQKFTGYPIRHRLRGSWAHCSVTSLETLHGGQQYILQAVKYIAESEHSRHWVGYPLPNGALGTNKFHLHAFIEDTIIYEIL